MEQDLRLDEHLHQFGLPDDIELADEEQRLRLRPEIDKLIQERIVTSRSINIKAMTQYWKRLIKCSNY